MPHRRTNPDSLGLDGTGMFEVDEYRETLEYEKTSEMKYCIECFVTDGKSTDSPRRCSICEKFICDKHTHVFGKHPRCKSCQEEEAAG